MIFPFHAHQVLSDNGINFIRSLLRKETQNRLGFHNGAQDLLSHPWFADFDFEALAKRELVSPFVSSSHKSMKWQYFNVKNSVSVVDPPDHKKKLIEDSMESFSQFDSFITNISNNLSQK